MSTRNVLRLYAKTEKNGVCLTHLHAVTRLLYTLASLTTPLGRKSQTRDEQNVEPISFSKSRTDCYYPSSIKCYVDYHGRRGGAGGGAV